VSASPVTKRRFRRLLVVGILSVLTFGYRQYRLSTAPDPAEQLRRP